MNNVIEVKNLSKTFKVKVKEKGFIGSLKSIIKPKYKTIKAVNDVSFNVEKGEIIAFIGPNGAGKSTTTKMFTGILYNTQCSISIMGIDPTKKRKKLAYEIGTVFGEKEQLWTHLTPYDNFKFFGAVQELPNLIMNGKIDTFLVQPKNVLISILTSKTKVSAIGDLIYGYILLFIYGFSIKNILLFSLFIIIGGIIVTAIAVIFGSLAFYITKANTITGNVIGQ